MRTNVALPNRDDDGRGEMQGWLQVDKRVHQLMWKFGLKNPTALAVLHFLVARLHRGTNGVIISYAAMCKVMGIAPSTAKASIAALAKTNFLQVLKSGKSNVYVINSQVAWQGPRGARFASFNAEILVSEDEQTEPVDKLIEDAKKLEKLPQLFDGERLLIGNEEGPPPDQQELELP